MTKNIFNANSDIYLEYGYLMLPVSLSIVSKIIIGSTPFFPKDRFHISLLRLKDLPLSFQKKVFSFAKKYSVKISLITKTYRLVIKEDLQSIIVRVRLRGLRKLISAINHRFGYSFVYPPTHITLFVLKDQHGIGVNSTGDYRRLTLPISQKDTQVLAKSFKLI